MRKRFGFATLGLLVSFLLDSLVITCAAQFSQFKFFTRMSPYRVSPRQVSDLVELEYWKWAFRAMQEYNTDLDNKVREIEAALNACENKLSRNDSLLTGRREVDLQAPAGSVNYYLSDRIESYKTAVESLKNLNQALENRITVLKSELDDCSHRIPEAHPDPDP